MHGSSLQQSWRALESVLKISSFVAGVFFLAFGLCAHADDSAPDAAEIFAKMTPQQRVGQVFIWTYPGLSLNSQGEAWLEKFQPGALIVFGRNIKTPDQIAKFNSDLQKFAARKMKAPFFLMIDQEGGTVTRLRTQVPLPSALALGKMTDSKFTQAFGKALGTMLKSLGFNVNLAPVLDISPPTKDTFIGNRTFGEDPATVSERAGAYAMGLHEGGVMPTAKHFPGHGGVAQDSHQTLPKKLATYEELAEKDLVPFQSFAKAQYPRAMMMAHMALPNIDPTGVPSTYSKVVIQDNLRDRMGYGGLVITDDLEMAGASSDDDRGEHAIRAFLAGNDMIMLAGVGAHQKQAFTKFLAAVKSGRISEARLRESVERVLEYKIKMGIAPFKFSDKDAKTSIAALEALSKQVLQKNFRMALENRSVPWPEITPETRVLVLGSERRFFQSFQKNFRGKAKFFQLTPATLEKAGKEIEKTPCDLIVYYASGVQTARWLVNLKPEQRAKMVVVNANNDAEVDGQGAFLTVLNISTHCPDCGSDLGDSMNNPEVRAPAQSTPELGNESAVPIPTPSPSPVE